jgi:hypothetical protein
MDESTIMFQITLPQAEEEMGENGTNMCRHSVSETNTTMATATTTTALMQNLQQESIRI